jgi:hypothetical protein
VGARAFGGSTRSASGVRRTIATASCARDSASRADRTLVIAMNAATKLATVTAAATTPLVHDGESPSRGQNRGVQRRWREGIT